MKILLFSRLFATVFAASLSISAFAQVASVPQPSSFFLNDDSLMLPDGTLVAPSTINPDGSINLPVESTNTQEMPFQNEDGSITLPDGTIINADGTIILPESMEYDLDLANDEDVAVGPSQG